jgi:hypothetical protein
LPSTNGAWLLCISKDGSIEGVNTARLNLKISADYHNYALAQKTAKKVGLIYSCDKTSQKPEVALVFATAFDLEANKR